MTQTDGGLALCLSAALADFSSGNCHLASNEHSFDAKATILTVSYISKAVAITLHLLCSPLRNIMQVRVTFATNNVGSSRFVWTTARKQRRRGLCMQLNKLTSSSYGKLRRLAPLHRTQQHIPHVRALNAPNNAKAESKQTKERKPVHQLRLLDEVANVVPVDLDLDLSFEGDEYMKGMLNVQAVLSQPGLALLWHKAESRAIPCLGQCLKALTFSYGSGSNYAETYDETRNIAKLELFCEEVDSYFTSSSESLDRYILACLCVKVGLTNSSCASTGLSQANMQADACCFVDHMLCNVVYTYCLYAAFICSIHVS